MIVRRYSLGLLLIIFFSLNITTVAQRQQDSLALVALYNSTDGPNWINNTNWLTNQPIDNWFGISVENNRVIKLELPGNNLIGAIPSQICDLSQLEGLGLYSNNFSGTIPIEIFNLINLKYLALDTRNSIDTIPSQIGNLRNLIGLWLNGHFSGRIPPEIGNCILLETIDLWANNDGLDAGISGNIPKEIGNLINLKYLELGANKISGNIPPELGNCTKLTYVNFVRNQLTGSVPPEIGNLTNLESLYLSVNMLSGKIPKELGNLSKIKILTFDNNNFSDSIPNEFTNLSFLEVLHLGADNFSYLPNLNNLKIIKTLTMQDNQFEFDDIEPNINIASETFTYTPQDSVGIEQSVSVCEGQPYTLDIIVGGVNNRYQWFKDDIQITPITSNSSFTIPSISAVNSGKYNCHITNTLATELTLYSRPIILSIASLGQDSLALVALYNSTNGANWTNHTNWLTNQPIDTWYGVTVENCSITMISLKGNYLIGNLPTEICKLKNLQFLDLGYNDITGGIPSEIGNLDSLKYLSLMMNNNLGGTIPKTIGNLKKLSMLQLRRTNLGGKIPPEIGDLVSLEVLNLSDNSFVDSLPKEIGNLKNLTSLHIYWCLGITGSIPKEIGNLTNLTDLWLGPIGLTGSIPKEIGNLTKLVSLIIYGSSVSGSIPAEIGNLNNLKTIELSGNKLSGNIPIELSKIPNLSEMIITYNKLDDSLLIGTQPYKELKTMDLSNNQLQNIPNLTRLDSLKILSLNNNKLEFDDIEPNLNVASETFVYSPQDSVGIEQSVSVCSGSPYTLDIQVGGANNRYQWFKDDLPITTITFNSSFTIPSLIVANSGRYNCHITNTLATELTLYSRPIILSIASSSQDSLALVALYKSTNGDNWTNNTNWLTSQPIDTWFGITVENCRVHKIEFHNNNLTGNIPPEIGNLDSLEVLSVFGCHLDTIPEEIGNLKKLYDLTFYDCELNCPIPSSIWNMVNLWNLNLRGNVGLTGKLPKEIGNLVNLEYLWLWCNQLTGPIPPEIKNCKKLRLLDLAVNPLTGNIPKELGELQFLETLWLNVCGLSGTIPDEIGDIKTLNSIQLFGNYLTGNVPANFSNLINLSQLWISNNKLEKLPDLSSLSNLQTLGIELNRFEFDDIEPNLNVASETFTYAPQDSVGIAKTDSICTGASYKMDVNVGGTNNRYQWFHNGTAVSGLDTKSSFLLPLCTQAEAGIYECHITNTLATQLTLYSRKYRLKVISPPVTPSITQSIDTLFSSATNGNQWYLNDTIIPDATSQKYEPVTEGNYTVIVSDTNGCQSSFSLAYSFTFEVIASAELNIESFTAAPGDTIFIPIKLGSNNNLMKSKAKEFIGTLKLNATLLEPIGNTPVGIIKDGERYMPFSISKNANANNILTAFIFRATLGNAISTTLELDSLRSDTSIVNLKGNPGVFTLKGVCLEGGPRLINSTGKIDLMLARPNPTSDICEIEYEVIETGVTKLYITSTMGLKVLELIDGNIEKGRRIMTVDVSGLSSGGYFVVFETPTERRVVRLNVLK